MIEVGPGDVGRRVTYVDEGRGVREHGVITSVPRSCSFIFVSYDDQHPEAHGKATSKADLFWEKLEEVSSGQGA